MVVNASPRMDQNGAAWNLADTRSSPNLMAESSVDDLATMMTALSFHVGEVQRNPYHLTLPDVKRANHARVKFFTVD